MNLNGLVTRARKQRENPYPYRSAYLRTRWYDVALGWLPFIALAGAVVLLFAFFAR